MAFVIDGGVRLATKEEDDEEVYELLSHLRDAQVGCALVTSEYTLPDLERGLVKAAQANPEMLLAVPTIEVDYPESAAMFDEFAASSAVAGIRFRTLYLWDRMDWVEEPDTLRLWEKAATWRTPVFLHRVMERRLDECVRRVADRFPDVPIVLERLFRGVLGLADVPNIYSTFSAADLEFTDHWTDDKSGQWSPWESGTGGGRSAAQNPVQVLVQAFGANRLMWASDYRLHGRAVPSQYQSSIKENLAWAHRQLSFAAADELDWLLGRTAQNLFLSAANRSRRRDNPLSAPRNQWEYLEIWVDDSEDPFARKWEYLKVPADDSEDPFARKRKLKGRRILRRGPVQFNLGRDIANFGYELLDSKEESPGVYRFFLRRPSGMEPPPWEYLEDEC